MFGVVAVGQELELGVEDVVVLPDHQVATGPVQTKMDLGPGRLTPIVLPVFVLEYQQQNYYFS